MNYLLITESPAKAKKIQKFLPNNYTVKSSCGHIIDLEKKNYELMLQMILNQHIKFYQIKKISYQC